MRQGLSRVVFAVATASAIALVALAALPAVGQGQTPAPAYRSPRTADGRPNLNGIWQANNEANYDLQSHMARPAMALRAGPFGPLPAAPVLAFGAVGAVPPGPGVVDGDGVIPYLPAALEQKRKNQENWLTLDPEVKCYLPGVPRATYMPQPFQIFQSASAIFIAYQYAGAVRNVFLKDPGPAPIDSWMGQSVARWEGESLVIDASGFNDQSWFDRAGNYHSDQLKVTERYTRVQPDVLNYEATMTDPQIFSRPWKISMPLYRRLDRGAQIMDFKCVEFVEELMYGQWRKTPLPR